MTSSETYHAPSLHRSRRLATYALLSAVTVWFVLMVLVKLFPEYTWLLHILMLSAEAGVVGGLADWYAITVLFRNPFGKMPIPKFLRDHTEIIPRNKTRIAESMGRFVQENFLSPTVVQRSLAKIDASLSVGQWLSTSKNSEKLVEVVQQTLPKILDFASEKNIADFIQNNSVQWVKNTDINRLASEMLRAVLENDFHQDVLQRGLDSIHAWMVDQPEQTREITRQLFKELGVWSLARGASFIGIDVQQRMIDALIEKVESMLEQPDHPWRQQIESSALQMMQNLTDDDSAASQRLNQAKNALLSSPQILSFLSSATMILCNAIRNDLNRPDSGIALNLRAAIHQIGESLISNDKVREVLNAQLTELAILFSDQYSDKIIRYISERIHEWDSREMIAKIENEVGGDLHMIRVNGVVVGAFIGLVLGILRFAVEHLL